MSRYPILCLILSLMLLAGSIPPAGAAVTLNMQLVGDASNLEVFFLEDLNISGQAPSAEVFRITIDFDQAYDAFIRFYMEKSYTTIMSGESEVFKLDSVETPPPYVITNLNLTEVGTYQLTSYEISSGAEDIEDKLLQTGYFPSGTYKLIVEIYQDQPEVKLAYDEIQVIITNPFDIYLISPIGTPGSPAILNMTTPVFTWTASASQFLLKICERTFMGMDPESVMQGRPHYETDPSTPLMGQSFPYPPFGVRALEPGHTYYWQVTSLVQTSGGLKEYTSQIGAFTILLILDPEAQQVAQALQEILGLSFQSVMGDLSGYQPTGKVYLDGKAITLEELNEIVQQFEQGVYQTTKVSAE